MYIECTTAFWWFSDSPELPARMDPLDKVPQPLQILA